MADLPANEGPWELRDAAAHIEALFWLWRAHNGYGTKKFDNPKAPNRSYFLKAAAECADQARPMTPEQLVLRRLHGALGFGLRITPAVLIAEKLRKLNSELMAYGDTTTRCQRYLVDVQLFEHRSDLYGIAPTLRDHTLQILPFTRYLLAKQHDLHDVMEANVERARYEMVFYSQAGKAMFKLPMIAELLP